MRGCETCSGLVDAGDASCPTCGAETARTAARSPHDPLREDRGITTVLAVLFGLIAAGWLAAAVYWIG